MLGSMSDTNDLEEGKIQQLDCDKVWEIGRSGHRVSPVVLQDADTGEVLFVAYTNDEAFRMTLQLRTAVLYSTSRDEVWHKGATSGDTLSLVDVRVNCEQNSLLYRVRREGGGACHTSGENGTTRAGCYYRTVVNSDELAFAE